MSFFEKRNRKNIWKRLGVLFLAAALLVPGTLACGAKKVQDTQMNAYENGTTPMVLGDVRFEVPSDWKAEETGEGRLVAVATDDAGTDVAFTFTYTIFNRQRRLCQIGKSKQRN